MIKSCHTRLPVDRATLINGKTDNEITKTAVEQPQVNLNAVFMLTLLHRSFCG
jgi:hypothetical protein